jgi:RNA ligase
MNYEFPIIERITDVLPAIAGRDEFIVAEREGYRVINYTVGFADTFNIDPDDVMENYGRLIPKGVMRRECRGLIFGPDGLLMSRPFHKFFNVGERAETQPNVLDMSQPHVVFEKMDGSMIRPIWLRAVQGLRLATKMGVTDTAIAAEAIATPAQMAWMLTMVRQGVTPLFEFISPENRIVLEYDRTELVLLAMRVNRTGEYLDVREMVGNEFFSVVPHYGSVDGNINEYIDRQRGKAGREGDVIRFDNGHMLKVKNDWYVRVHKVKDQIRTDRHILALLLNGELDDVKAHIGQADRDRVDAYERRFHDAFRAKLAEMEGKAEALLGMAGGNRKTLATVVLPSSGLPAAEWGFMFNAANGRSMNEMLMKFVTDKLGNTARYNEMAAFLGLAEDVGDEVAE